jgi:peroxiredoxin
VVTARSTLVIAAALAACGVPAKSGPPALPDRSLPATDGASRSLAELTRAAPLTVVVFFSADCACQRAHDARLRELHAAYRPRGVQFVAVDAEATSSPTRDAAEAAARGYPFPILSDPDGITADALGAVSATHVVVLDAAGTVHYRGGLDSDRNTLTPSASPWLRGALDRLLAGREPEPVETASLGCVLRRR